MIYTLHHAAAFIGAVLVCPALLYRRKWTRLYPRLAVLMWHLLVATAGLAVFGLLISAALRALGVGVAPALGAIGTGERDMRELSAGEHVVLLAAFVFLAALVLWCALAIRQRRQVRDRHRSLLRVVAPGRRGSITVIDHRAALMYAVPGRDPHIVTTSAVVDNLGDSELQAALAHEHHHLNARHDLALLPFTLLRRVFRRAAVFATLEEEIDLLLEMCADDYAARHGHRDALRRAIAWFNEVGRAAPAPAGHCTAGGALVDRESRLGANRLATRPAIVVACYANVLTFTFTTLSLYFMPT